MSNVKNQFKDTLNLPKTQFPMKANLNQNEPQRIKKWLAQNQYQSLQDYFADCPAFIFHDGPPYANGHIHIGHLLNKVLKDLVVRSQFLLGKRCELIPGWDCHGLPIEHKVLSELSPSKKEKLAQLDPDKERLAIRNECQQYAEKFIKLQSDQMKRLLTLADYDHPYLTFQPEFEANVLTVFSKMVKEGIVFRQLKPVHWSIANQTALAEAELEYIDKTSSTVAVKFPIPSHPFTLNQPLSAVIWTTTPWTLPANLAIAFGDEIDYVIALINGDACLLAKDRLEFVSSYVEVSVIQSVSSQDLHGLIAKHPFIDQPAPLLPANFVTTEDGTGLVHIAPGHGMDDYLLGQQHQLPTYCPVQADGTYDDRVPKSLIGASIWDANSQIIDLLTQTNHLVFKDTITHSYPHDWRSKTPVIFRSTDQWFIGVDIPLKSCKKTLRHMATNTIQDDVSFVPTAGKARLKGMLESRPDWCISRQRSWGLPIPAFKDSQGRILLTEQSVLHIAKHVQSKGSDCWFRESADTLLLGYSPDSDPESPEFDVASAEKLYDIFDVWFESGSSWFAVLNQRQQVSQADLYLEGSDQHRGWFHLSLLASLAAQQKAPYKAVLTHGFIVDKDGRKMSKSAGNAFQVDTLLQTHGAEVTRWWVGSLSYENDIKVDPSFFKEAGDLYRKIRNTLRFILSNLSDFSMSFEDCVTSAQSFSETHVDRYILSQAMQFEQSVLQDYERYRFKDASTKIYQFCTDDLSSVYLSTIKDRLYCDPVDSPARRRAQITCRILIEVLLRLLRPILPHTCEEAIESLCPDASSFETIKAVRLSVPDAHADWPVVMDIRKRVLKALETAKESGIENSLDAGILLPKDIPDAFLPECADLFGVSRVAFHEDTSILVQNLQQELRCERSWKRDTSVQQRPDGSILSERDYHAITNH